MSRRPSSRFATIATACELVEDDKLDAYVADRGILAAMLREGGRPGFELSKQYFSYETYALALPRDDSAFRLLVDRTLAQLYRTGRIKAILAKTFGPRSRTTCSTPCS